MRIRNVERRSEKGILKKGVEKGMKREKEKTRIKDTVINFFHFFFDQMINHNIIHRYL